MAKHIHKYMLKQLGPKKSYEVYACVLPGCGHYVDTALAIGKESICWRCGDKCIITVPRSCILLKKPHCMDCTKKYPQHAAKLRRQGGEQAAPEISLKELEDMSLDDLLSDDMFETANDKKKE